MAEINWESLRDEMIAAASQAATENWEKLSSWAIPEFEKLAMSAADVERRKNADDNSPEKISPEKARVLLQMHKSTAKIIILSVEGISMIVLEAAWNAAVAVLRSTVLAAVGIPV